MNKTIASSLQKAIRTPIGFADSGEKLSYDETPECCCGSQQVLADRYQHPGVWANAEDDLHA